MNESDRLPTPVASTPDPGQPFCCCWSGGKDSCLALDRCVRAGASPKALVTVFGEDGVRTRSHGLHRSVIEGQARELGLELFTVSTSWDAYEKSLGRLLRRVRKAGIEAVAFGDLDIEAHGLWELRVARSAGLTGHLPLWGSSRPRVLEEWWEMGFEARIVVVRENVIPRSFLGRVLDRELARELDELGVDLCGENGEFHTMATDGPLFRRRLPVFMGRRVKRKDCWTVDVALRADATGRRPAL